jgi:hypothetical protein
MKNSHYYRVELYYTIIDMQFQELNSRFNEMNSELLLCIVYLSPNDLFVAFKEERLLWLTQFYHNNFSTV